MVMRAAGSGWKILRMRSLHSADTALPRARGSA